MPQVGNRICRRGKRKPLCECVYAAEALSSPVVGRLFERFRIETSEPSRPDDDERVLTYSCEHLPRLG